MKTRTWANARLTAASAVDCNHNGPSTSAQKHAVTMSTTGVTSQGELAYRGRDLRGQRIFSRVPSALLLHVLPPGSERVVARMLIRLPAGP